MGKAFWEIKDSSVFLFIYISGFNTPPTESQLMQKASILPCSIDETGKKLGEGEVEILKIHYIK